MQGLFVLLMLSMVYGLSDDATKTKGRIARFIFKNDLNEPGVIKNVSVIWEEEESTPQIMGRFAQLHTTFSNRYYLSDFNEISELEPNSLDKSFALKPLEKITHSDTPRIVEITTWEEKLYFVSCYDGDYCDIFERLYGKPKIYMHSIQFTYEPKILKFFVQENNLNMIVVGESSSIYRWMGTYFDETEIWETPGTKSLIFFPFDNSLILVFAQDFKENGICSVYKRKNETTKLIQRLYCEKAHYVVHYWLNTRHGDQNYVMILSKSNESPTFWWNGKTFSEWAKVTNIESPDSAFMGYFQSEPFMFIASKGSVSMYHIKTTELSLVRTVKTDGSIISFAAEDPNLFFLISRDSGSRQIVTVSLRIHVVPIVVERKTIFDRLGTLLEKIKSRDILLRNISEQIPKLLLVKHSANLGKIIGKKLVVFNEVSIETLEINPPNVNILTIPREIVTSYAGLTERLSQLQSLIKLRIGEEAKYTVFGNLYAENLYVTDLMLSFLNGRKIVMDEILSLTKNQHIAISLNLTSVEIINFEPAYINNNSPEDILQKGVKEQILLGETRMKSIQAKNIRFGDIAKINGIYFGELASINNSKTIKGVKKSPELIVDRLKTFFTDSDQKNQWLRFLTSQTINKTYLETSLENLSAINLSVNYINGVSWEEFLQNLDDLNNRTDKLTTIEVKQINGIPVDKFFTVNEDQNITSHVSFPSITINNFKFQSINNATPEEVVELFQNVMKHLADGTMDFNQTVRVEGRMIASNVHFQSSAVLENSRSTIDFDSIPKDQYKSQKASESKNQKIGLPDVEKFTSVIIHGNVKVKNQFQTRIINGKNLKSVLDNVILLNQNNSLENVKIKHLFVDQADNFKFHLNGTGDTSGKIKLQSLIIKCTDVLKSKCPTKLLNIRVKGDLDGMVNSVDFGERSSNIFSKSKNQHITGGYHLQTLNTNYLHADSINLIPFENIVKTNTKQSQTIHSELFLNKLGALGNVTVVKLAKCDLHKVAFLNISSVEYYDSLEIVGNIEWQKSKPELRSLSYLFNNSVTKTGNYVISGETTFSKNMNTNMLNTSSHINNINLEFIAQDAVFSSKENQTISILAGFKSNLTTVNAHFSSTLSVDTIDNIEIIRFNSSLVRKDDNKEITGIKIFPKGFSVHKLIADQVHGIKSPDLIYTDDYMGTNENHKPLPKTTFKSLHILSNLTVAAINNRDMKNFTENLIDLTEDQRFTNEIHLKGNATINSLTANIVNSINLDEILDEETVKAMDGTLNFVEPVATADLKVKYFDGVNLKQRYEHFIKKNRDEIIQGNMTMNDNLLLSGNYDVVSINQCQLSDIYFIEENYNPKKFKTDNFTVLAMTTMDEIEEVLNREPPIIFQHLEKFANVAVEIRNIKSTSVEQREGQTLISVYGIVPGSCELPAAACLCPSQYVIAMNEYGEPVNITHNSNRTYTFFDTSLDVALHVKTNTISYSSRCLTNNSSIDEITEIIWKIAERESEKTVLRFGFLNDVKFFKLGKSIYIVMAFYYNRYASASGNNGFAIPIFELDTESSVLTKINAIPARGALIIDVVWANPSFVLIVANMRPEEGTVGSVYTEIYRLDEKLNKFELMKKIRTHTVTSVKGLQIENQSFIYIVQKQPWPLLAFKYNLENDNYVFSEKLYEKGGFSSVNSIAVSTKNTYVGVVYMNDMFSVFSYKQIEGLVEETSVKQKYVQALQQFTINGSHYLLGVSTTGSSIIYKVIS